MSEKTAKKPRVFKGDPMTLSDLEKAKEDLQKGVNLAQDLLFASWEEIAMAAIFNTMRILKKLNPGDGYLENYQGMRQKYGERFFDTYQVLWRIGASKTPPMRILEIGTRTGISLCQLLSAHTKRDEIETIVCVDPFDQWTSANLVRANLSYLNLPHSADQVKIHPVKSDDYFKQTDGNESFDFILVDGDHEKSAAARDLENAHKLLEAGGIIVFDDISTAPGECALLDVWEAWKGSHDGQYWFCEILEGKGVGVAVRK